MAETVELLVCVTCRYRDERDPDPEAPRPGLMLADALEGRVPEGVVLTRTECLSNCTRGCTVALRAPGAWTYVYGNFAPDQAEILLDGAARYAAAPQGLIPWRERPEHLRKNCIARIPPLEA